MVGKGQPPRSLRGARRAPAAARRYAARRTAHLLPHQRLLDVSPLQQAVHLLLGRLLPFCCCGCCSCEEASVAIISTAILGRLGACTKHDSRRQARNVAFHHAVAVRRSVMDARPPAAPSTGSHVSSPLRLVARGLGILPTINPSTPCCPLSSAPHAPRGACGRSKHFL